MPEHMHVEPLGSNPTEVRQVHAQRTSSIAKCAPNLQLDQVLKSTAVAIFFNFIFFSSQFKNVPSLKAET